MPNAVVQQNDACRRKEDHDAEGRPPERCCVCSKWITLRQTRATSGGARSTHEPSQSFGEVIWISKARTPLSACYLMHSIPSCLSGMHLVLNRAPRILWVRAAYRKLIHLLDAESRAIPIGTRAATDHTVYCRMPLCTGEAAMPGAIEFDCKVVHSRAAASMGP